MLWWLLFGVFNVVVVVVQCWFIFEVVASIVFNASFKIKFFNYFHNCGCCKLGVVEEVTNVKVDNDHMSSRLLPPGSG